MRGRGMNHSRRIWTTPGSLYATNTPTFTQNMAELAHYIIVFSMQGLGICSRNTRILV